MKFSNILTSVIRSFLGDYRVNEGDTRRGVDWIGSIPFMVLHIACLAVIWVGWSWFAVLFALIFYLVRMFSITAFYHRYFSHRSFKTHRFFQCLFAIWGCSAVQRGPLWWAAIHRHHHIYSDTEHDTHSPRIHGFLWSHIGWISARENYETRVKYVKDWIKFPELVFINRYAQVVPIVEAVIIFIVGALLGIHMPELNTDGPQLLIWGFFISTVVCSHATFSINSFDHMYGTRRYNTPDTSRNNFIATLFTLGEGWHNNHHHYPITARAGFYWWEIDITWYLLVILSWFRIVRELRPLPDHIRKKNRIPVEE